MRRLRGRSWTGVALLAGALIAAGLLVFAGDPPPALPPLDAAQADVGLRPDALLSRLREARPGAQVQRLSYRGEAQAARVQVIEGGVRRVLFLDPRSGTVLDERAGGPSVGERLAAWPAELWAALVLSCYALLCAAFLVRRRGRVDRVDDPWWILHASQSGTAAGLAARTAALFRACGQPCHVAPLADLRPEQLPRLRRALFVVSTHGEGEPPDGARRFKRQWMSGPAALGELNYALLALGDRRYARFCAFGRELDAWLAASGARSLFARVDVDGGDPLALRRWQHAVGALLGAPPAQDVWTPPDFETWTLGERRIVNPGSAGGPCFWLELIPPATARWNAGDALQLLPRHGPQQVEDWCRACGLDPDAPFAEGGVLRDRLAGCQLPDPESGLDAAHWLARLKPLAVREYSIASVAEDGHAGLLVRLQFDDRGRPGVGSGWLCLYAQPGERLAVRVRANPSFALPGDPATPLILIGNGTGIAGLRALWRARAQQGGGPIWLVAGERNAAHDALFADELDALLQRGVFTRIDRAWSRDAGGPRYVQDVLSAHAEALRDWVAHGAAIHVCGSLRGMAPAVDAALAEALGEGVLESLARDDRYRRDVY